jgi:hypothetical protein
MINRVRGLFFFNADFWHRNNLGYMVSSTDYAQSANIDSEPDNIGCKDATYKRFFPNYSLVNSNHKHLSEP